jgi:hypothetical protein
MRQQVRKHLHVIIDQVSLGIALTLPEDLIQVGYGYLQALYLDNFSALDRHNQHLLSKCITGTDPMMQNASWGLSP